METYRRETFPAFNPQPKSSIMNDQNISTEAKPNRAVFDRRLVLILLLLCAAAFNVPAGDIISVKFTSPKNSNQNWMYAGDFAGAPGVRTNGWNNMLAASDGSTANITLAAGTVSNSAGATVPGFAVTYHAGTGGGVFNRGNGATNDGKMFMDVSDTYGGSGYNNFNYVDFTNIPYTNFNIYCYFRPDNGNGSANTRGGFFSVTNGAGGTNRLYLQNQSNDVAQTQEPAPSTSGGNYVQSFTTSIPSGGTSWGSIAGGNYVVFYNLTNSWTRVWFGGLGNGSGSRDDLGNYVNGGSTAVRFKIAGFQIVQSVIETATNLYFVPPTNILHAGNPSPTATMVKADTLEGSLGMPVTPFCTFASDNTNVVTVLAGGALLPGTNGTAHVIASYQNVTATNLVTVIGPTSLALNVANTNLLCGTNGIGDTTTATLLATFSDATNVAVNAYNGYVSFSTTTPGVITLTSNGMLTAIGPGSFNVTGTYDGISVTTNSISGQYVGVVTNFIAPGGVPAISVNFADAANPLTYRNLSGAPGSRVAYWNNLFNSGKIVTNILSSVFDYQGNYYTNTAVYFVVATNGLNAGGQSAIGTRTTNESVMFNTYFDQGGDAGNSVTSFITVSNVPYSTYDVCFYFYNDSSQTTRVSQVTIDGVTQYRNNGPNGAAGLPDNNGNGYVTASPQPGTLPPSPSCQIIPFGNVIRFNSLTDSVLNVAWGAEGQDVFVDAAGVTRSRLAGFQLIYSGNGVATNLYLSQAVTNQLPGNTATYALTVLADYIDGRKGVNVTSGSTYASSNTNVFTVDTNGVITPGETPGTATLTFQYQSVTAQTNVTTLAPTSAQVVANPGTVYVDGNIPAYSSQAGLYATFTGYGRVNVSGFNGITYVDQTASDSIATMTSSGAISATGATGQANLGATYVGTTWVSTNAFTVRSVADAPVLAHQYLFTNAPGATTLADTIGGANGTVYGPFGTNKPITFDGSRAIFPGDADYTVEPYISLQPGIINQMGDVTIELWGGQRARNTWARFLSFGSTAKGLDPHNYGAEISILELLASYGSTGHADFFTPGHAADVQTAFSLTNNAEYHMVMVYAPNAGTVAFYINGVLIGSGSPTNQPLSTCVNDTVDWLGVSLANNDPPLAGWMNKLAIYEGVLSASQVYSNYTNGLSIYRPPVSTVPTNIVASVTGNTLTLSWPADHQGWQLQVQTNNLNSGLGTNWFTIPGSETVISTNIPIVSTNGSVFYRLMYQP